MFFVLSLKGFAWQTAARNNVATTLKIALDTMVAAEETLSGGENGWESITAVSGVTFDKDTSMYLDDTPDETTMITRSNIPGSPAAMQIDRELTPLQQSEKEAMETSRMISHALIRQLFAQDDDEEEDSDAVLFFTEYKYEIYRHLNKLEVSAQVHLEGIGDRGRSKND